MIKKNNKKESEHGTFSRFAPYAQKLKKLRVKAKTFFSPARQLKVVRFALPNLYCYLSLVLNRRYASNFGQKPLPRKAKSSFRLTCVVQTSLPKLLTSQCFAG